MNSATFSRRLRELRPSLDRIELVAPFEFDLTKTKDASITVSDGKLLSIRFKKGDVLLEHDFHISHLGIRPGPEFVLRFKTVDSYEIEIMIYPSFIGIVFSNERYLEDPLRRQLVTEEFPIDSDTYNFFSEKINEIIDKKLVSAKASEAAWSARKHLMAGLGAGAGASRKGGKRRRTRKHRTRKH